MRPATNRLAACLALILLSACTQDPMERPGTWSVPQGKLGANDANLRTMIQDPRDLTAGTGEENSTGPAAVAPVRRLLTGRRAPLPQSGISAIRVGGATPGPQPAAAGAAPQE